jgi:hypothetical protein
LPCGWGIRGKASPIRMRGSYEKTFRSGKNGDAGSGYKMLVRLIL